jgi:ribosomal protein S20
VLDKAVKRGVIKKGTAIRRKTRANEALRKIEA